MRDVLKPACLDELFALLEQYPDAMPLAGGTDLLVRLRRQTPTDERPLLSLADVKDLQRICAVGTNLAIGAAATFSSIIADPLIQEHAPLLATAVKTIGGPAVRNMATIGGNICTASPAGDSLTPLYLLEAEIEIASQRGRRLLPIAEFITGPGQTSLAHGEIVTRILLPIASPFPFQQFEKVGRRRSMAIAVTSFAGVARLSGDGIIEEARFAWGSVAPTVFRLRSLEAEFVGTRPDADMIAHASDVVRQSVSPISDIRATADYRRMVADNLLTRFLERLHA